MCHHLLRKLAKKKRKGKRKRHKIYNLAFVEKAIVIHLARIHLAYKTATEFTYLISFRNAR